MHFTTSVTILLYVEKYNVYETLFDFNIINMTNRWKDNFYVYHFLLLTVDVCQFLRLSASFGRFMAYGYPHWDPLNEVHN